KPLIKDLNDLQRYALEGHDIFKFERHFNNWKKSTMSYPILFIKYEHIWDNLPEIFDFLDIPKSEIKHFPKNTGRESGIEQQPAEVQRALLAMYGSFAQEVEKEKPIFIKNASLPSRQRRRVNLLTRYYHDPSLERQKEIEQCILANCRNEFIEKIYLFVKEDLDIDHFKSDKIEKVILGRCMTFDDAIMLCNSSLGGELCIIANTDIYFDESLKLLHGVNFHNLVLALTRHDVLADGSIQEMKGFYFNGEFRKCSPAYSQDAWILHAPLINVMPNFLPGTLGCERKLAHEFLKQKYMVLNPFKLIKAYHLHNSALRRHASYSIIGSAASKLCPVNPTLDLPLLAHNQFSQIHNLSTLRTAVSFLCSYYGVFQNSAQY
ncbi:hypothetical protein HYZ97_03055, partial [Candidatus Pacearchaeota archaeon]|nr:hypothetical protein [Candidatus Pacearchaeota archaeon]